MKDYEKIIGNLEKSKALARIVAHLMGDGCVTPRYFENQELINGYEKDILGLFKGVHIIRGKMNSGVKIIQIQNKKVNLFLRSLLGDFRSFSLEIPKFINSKELQKEFLSSFYDDEGCVALRVFKKTGEIKRNITLSSNSLKLLEEIKEILKESFQIETNNITKYEKRAGNKTFTNYVLGITGKENFIKFKEEINFFQPGKRERLDTLIDSYIRK